MNIPCGLLTISPNVVTFYKPIEPPEFFRITEDNKTRLTENNLERVTE